MPGVKQLQSKVGESVRNIWLAGLGAASMAQEEGSKLFESLVNRGEEVEKHGGSPVTRMKEGFKEATDKASTTWDSIAQKIDEQVTASLHRAGVPTREEIATLTRRVDALIVSVDKLRARTPGASAAEHADDAIVIKA